MPAKLIFPDDVRPDFEGFSKAGFAFLRELAQNNERGWFTERKETYEAEVRFPLECLVAEFTPDRSGKGLPVRGDPARAIFRIHRDVRFSKNKQPYKTHAGAILSRSGARGDPGVVYIHIQPKGCFLSAGFWRSDPVMLTAWRQAMIEDPEAWRAIVDPHEDGNDVTYMRTISALKTMPRGFKDQAESPVAEYLKWKSFLLTRTLKDDEVMDRGLIPLIREHTLKAQPLLEFGWRFSDMAAEADPRKHMRDAKAKASK